MWCFSVAAIRRVIYPERGYCSRICGLGHWQVLGQPYLKQEILQLLSETGACPIA